MRVSTRRADYSGVRESRHPVSAFSIQRTVTTSQRSQKVAAKKSGAKCAFPLGVLIVRASENPDILFPHSAFNALSQPVSAPKRSRLKNPARNARFHSACRL